MGSTGKPQWVRAYERFSERKDWLDEMIAPYLFEEAEPNEAALKMLYEEQQMVERALRAVGEGMLMYGMGRFKRNGTADVAEAEEQSSGGGYGLS